MKFISNYRIIMNKLYFFFDNTNSSLKYVQLYISYVSYESKLLPANSSCYPGSVGLAQTDHICPRHHLGAIRGPVFCPYSIKYCPDRAHILPI